MLFLPLGKWDMICVRLATNGLIFSGATQVNIQLVTSLSLSNFTGLG